MRSRPYKEKANEIDIFENKKTNKIYVTSQFSEVDTKDVARFASQVIDGEETHYFF